MGCTKLLYLVTGMLISVFVQRNSGQKYIYRMDAIVKSDGYVLETHHLLTTDDYVLALHRIPYRRFSNYAVAKRPVILLMHGMFGASNSFISLGPEYSIAYNLADAGFDVWMCNARGTKNSRFHNELDPDSPYDKQSFFDFTYEEIGLYDLAESVDFILTMTESTKLHFIGFGAGGTAFLVLNSMKPEYNEKFSTAHLLAAVGYQRHFNNELLLALSKFTNTYYRLWYTIGLVELFPPGAADNAVDGLEVPRYCSGDLIYGDVCELMGVAEIMGTHLLHALVDSETAGASVKQLAHYGQNVRARKFRRWDYGTPDNLKRYGSESPPEYNLKYVTVNVTLHYSEGDHLVNVNDVLDMAKDMPNCVIRKVTQADFEHFDYIVDPAVKRLVTDFIVLHILDTDEHALRDVYLQPWYEYKDKKTWKTYSSQNPNQNFYYSKTKF